MSSAGDSKRFGFPNDDKGLPSDSRRAAIEYDASQAGVGLIK